MPLRPRQKELLASSSVDIPYGEWADFLRDFSGRYRGCPVRLDTDDLQTGEQVKSGWLPLQKIELDLEDAQNPRINVIVAMDNKTIKHILYRPTRLVLYLSPEGNDEAVGIESQNVSTVVRVRAWVEHGIGFMPSLI